MVKLTGDVKKVEAEIVDGAKKVVADVNIVKAFIIKIIDFVKGIKRPTWIWVARIAICLVSAILTGLVGITGWFAFAIGFVVGGLVFWFIK